MSKKLYIKSYGCQMNEYDANRIQDLMANEGYGTTDNADDADLIILNTCHIREKASEKLYSDVGRYKKIKQQDAILAIVGCTAQAEGDQMMKRAPVIDMVIGPQNYHNLPKLVKAHESGKHRQVDTDFPLESKFDYLPEITSKNGITAFLAVQEGCDKFCSFCVVPFTRGAEYSRKAQDIIYEANKLCEQGVREITLLGQNVNAWHGLGLDGNIWNLAKLIAELSKIPEIWRLRYVTSHPLEMDDELIFAHRDNPKLQPWLHLPIQSGSDTILKAMNRRHSAKDYCEIIDKFKKIRPDMAFSSDFIVGFPGETHQDFADTIRLVRQVGYASAFSFKYSPRPGTKAAEMVQCDESLKTERLLMLQELLLAQQIGFNESMVGKEIPVLFERKSLKNMQLQDNPTDLLTQWVGRSPYMQMVHINDSANLEGVLKNTLIKRAESHSIFA